MGFRYHHFRQRPQIGLRHPCQCIPERGNPHDAYAVLVKDGEIIIGRVPKKVCNIIHIRQDIHRTLESATCYFTGSLINDGPVVGVALNLHVFMY